MNKYVIYTALTGSYDNIMQPKVIASDFDYICFTNNDKISNAGIWQVKQIPLVTDDLQRLSRFPKMHPHVLLAEYEYCVYIDANVCIVSDEFYEVVRKKISTGVKLSGIKHPLRNCVYDEFYHVWMWRKEKNMSIMKKEYRYLQEHGFPKEFGMYEANIILRNHHDMQVIIQCEQWWLMVNTFSKRDQLSYSFTLWSQKLPFDYLCKPGVNRENNLYSVINHQSSRKHKNLYQKFVGKIEREFFHYLLTHNASLVHRIFNSLLR